MREEEKKKLGNTTWNSISSTFTGSLKLVIVFVYVFAFMIEMRVESFMFGCSAARCCIIHFAKARERES